VISRTLYVIELLLKCSPTKLEEERRPSSSSPSYLARRFTGLSIVRRATSSETSDEVRGPLGLNLLYEPSEPLVDFIFVHDLRGGSRKTWSKTESPSHYWPQRWLPLEPELKNVRIHSFGYSSDWGERKGSALAIHDFGRALIEEVNTSLRLNRHQTPLVFVGYGTGGLVIKKAFLIAKLDPSLHRLASRFQSIFFIATPHPGAEAPQRLENVLRNMLRFSGAKPNLSDLKSGSGAIQSINDEFRHVYKGIQLWSFLETLSSGSLGLIVDKDSGVLGLPNENVRLLNADHRGVCKFDAPADNNYRTICNAFISAIDGLEDTWYSNRKDDHQTEMKTITEFLGVADRPEADLAHVVDKRTDGSCIWLTKLPDFQLWIEGDEGAPKVFWLTGEPGTGKSVLAGHVVNYLEQRGSEHYYFFFKDGDAMKSTVSQLLRTLAWQMAFASAAFRRQLLEMHRNGDTVDKRDERSLWRAVFLNGIFQSTFSQPVVWVIDGLDECSNSLALLPLLSKVNKNIPLKIFITSRPSMQVERLFEQEKILKYSASPNLESSMSDIRLHVEAQSHYLPVDDDNLNGRKDLIDQIVDKSNGKFLWASLVTQKLSTANSEAQIRDILKSVPEGMDSYYRRILDDLLTSPRNVNLVKAILRWTVCAARPLTTDELKDAITYDIGEVVPRLGRDASAICGHLVSVDKHMRVQMYHATVRAFLIRDDLATGDNASELAVVRIKEHSRIARVCLDYLSGPEMKPPRYRRGRILARQNKRSVFADYAIANFAEHVARATSAEDAHLIALQSFLQTNVLTWIEVVAASGDLQPLVQTTKQLKTYMDRRAKYMPPMGEKIGNISSWTTDLIHIVARFGKLVLADPTAIHILIPPLCPSNSMVRKVAQSNPRGFRMAGLSQQDWDDRLSCIVLHGTRILSVASCDNRFCLGLSDHTVHVYNNTTFQEELQLNLGDPVRSVKYANTSTFLVMASRRTLQLWNVTDGSLRWDATLPGQARAIEFSEDDSRLFVATEANTLFIWQVSDGTLIDTFHFRDFDEDAQVDFRYQRPATYAAISPGLNRLAVAYRQRPITIWDMTDHTFQGQFHKGATTYPSALIVAMLFNPKPDLELAAVAYHGGDIVVFDVCTLQECATATAEATILASSPDGTILAASEGSCGIVSLYDFETLRLLYRLNSYEEDISMMVFASNGLRFFDVRGDQCNVWEPPVLVRRTDQGDDSSLGVSEEVTSGPQTFTSRTYNEDLVITAVVAHHDADVIFCGRENGSVAIYTADTGRCIQELLTQGHNVAVLSLIWNASKSLLGIADRSARFVVHKVSKTSSGEVLVAEPLLDVEMSSIIEQTMFNPSGTHVLISGSDTDVLWRIEDSTQLSSHKAAVDRQSWSWVSHPAKETQLLLICNGYAHIFLWDSLTQVTKPGGIELVPPTDASLLVSDSIGSPKGGNLCLRFLRPRTSRASPQFCLWPSEKLQPERELARSLISYPSLATQMKHIIGIFKTDLLFLDHDGWVCSLKIEPATPERFYVKHFFIPYGWHSIRDNLTMGVTEKGAVFMAARDELAVFHCGLETEEKFSIGDAEVKAVPPLPSTARRGTVP
jgi:WD40 repeat protein